MTTLPPQPMYKSNRNYPDNRCAR